MAQRPVFSAAQLQASRSIVSLIMWSLDAGLICGVEDVIQPDVVIAVGIVVYQVKKGVALGRVASDAIVGRAGGDCYPSHAITVGRVFFELVLRAGFEKNSRFRDISRTSSIASDAFSEISVRCSRAGLSLATEFKPMSAQFFTIIRESGDELFRQAKQST